MNQTKHILRFIWVGAIVVLIVFYLIKPEVFTAESIKGFLEANRDYIWTLYIALSFVKALFLLPNTPFVFAGLLLFPESPFAVFMISLTSILIGGCFVYYFSGRLKMLGNLFEKETERIQKYKRLLDRYGFWIVFLWAFLPVTPTNLICFVAGGSSIPFRKFFLGLFLGQVLILILYVFLADWVGSFF